MTNIHIHGNVYPLYIFVEKDPIQYCAVEFQHNCTILPLAAKNITKCGLSWPLALAAYFVIGILLDSQKQLLTKIPEPGLDGSCPYV